MYTEDVHLFALLVYLLFKKNMESPVPTEAQIPNISKTETRPNKKLWIILGILVIVVLCICAGIAAFLYARQLNQPPVDSSPNARCEYNGKSYRVGETFTADDGCNTCSCGENGMAACTLKFCAPDDETPDSSEEPTAPPVYKPIIKEGFTVRTSTECGIKVPVPPATAPYYEEIGTMYHRWDFSEYQTEGEVVFPKGNVQVRHNPYDKATNGIIGNDSPYRTIRIQCGENKNYTFSNLITAYEADLDRAKSIMPDAEYEVKAVGAPTSKWGQTVQKVTVTGPWESGDIDYLVLTEDLVYRVSMTYDPSGTQLVHDTMDDIFDNFEFVK